MARKVSKKKTTKKKASTKLKRKILPVFNTPKRSKAKPRVITKRQVAKSMEITKAADVVKTTNPGNGFPLWPDAKCDACGHDASDDPNGECYAYKLTCPVCGREGCDECMPLGRGVACPDCENEEEYEVP